MTSPAPKRTRTQDNWGRAYFGWKDPEPDLGPAVEEPIALQLELDRLDYEEAERRALEQREAGRYDDEDWGLEGLYG